MHAAGAVVPRDMECGEHYGRLNSLGATTPTLGTPFRCRNDSSSSLLASGSIPTSVPMECTDHVSNGGGVTPVNTGSQCLVQKWTPF